MLFILFENEFSSIHKLISPPKENFSLFNYKVLKFAKVLFDSRTLIIVITGVESLICGWSSYIQN